MTNGGETSSKILLALDRKGYPTSKRQLANWHRDGYLPAPETRALGHARGSVSTYPSGTLRDAIALAQQHKMHRRLSYAAWAAFWDRKASADMARPQLRLLAAKLDTEVNQIRVDVVGELNGDPRADFQMDKVYKYLNAARDPFVQKIRRAGVSPDSVARLMLLVGTGSLTPTMPGIDDYVRDFEKATYLDKARTGIGPLPGWYSGNLLDDLVDISNQMAKAEFITCAESDTSILTAARDELQLVLRAAGLLTFAFRSLTLPAGTMGVLAASAPTPFEQSGLMLYWLRIRGLIDLPPAIRTLSIATRPLARALGRPL